MNEWAPKVFWSEVSVAETGNNFTILLDGKPVKTPQKSDLEVPTRAFADAMANEWRALDNKIDPEKLPLTKLANASIDKIPDQLDGIISMLAEYATTDLLCYRAEKPEDLMKRQEEAWQPLLDWFENNHGIKLVTSCGVMPIAQTDQVLDICRNLLKKFSNFELAAIYDLIMLSGSFVIGLATAEGHIEHGHAWDISRIDEEWQISEWGEDEEAASMETKKRNSFLDAEKFFGLSRKKA